jgi:hypothetical protein
VAKPLGRGERQAPVARAIGKVHDVPQRPHALDPDVAAPKPGRPPTWIEVSKAAVLRTRVLELGGRCRDHRAS